LDGKRAGEIVKSEYKTKPRNRIIEYLKQNADIKFTARDIYNKLEKDGETINRATVYRNLERLYQEGKLIRYKESDSNATCYQYSENHGQCNHHMHAQCTECGKIFHLNKEFVEEFEEKVHLVYGVDVDCSKTVIVGKCNECKK
jgi:Fe2+ or Zn2+ uptake regulation protein